MDFHVKLGESIPFSRYSSRSLCDGRDERRRRTQVIIYDGKAHYSVCLIITTYSCLIIIVEFAIVHSMPQDFRSACSGAMHGASSRRLDGDSLRSMLSSYPPGKQKHYTIATTI